MPPPPELDNAWHTVQMTAGGNTVFRRSLFLAVGGFPQDQLFRRFGGEGGALQLALIRTTVVGTLFGKSDSVQPVAGVLHSCRKGMHAERLLDAILFKQYDPLVMSHMAQANQVTDRIIQQLQ
ncbi:hypothetical protein [Chelonobacter oris]|uniref:hypothetical protein n=1 Tax=Chelonobacter oris TaxID=505317 RepID=UPI003133A1A1